MEGTDFLAIKSVIENEHFDIVFQPVVNIQEGRVLYYEVLSRFEMPGFESGQYLSTEQTIQLIESCDLNYDFDFRVLSKALKTVNEIRSKNGLYISVAVNFCAKTISEESFTSDLSLLLFKYDIEPAKLVIEITERAALSERLHSIVLPGLAELGYLIAADDFMSGYSNFSVLSDPNIKIIKIDKSVTHNLESSEFARKFMRGIFFLIESLGKKVIVEGVESSAQHLFLSTIGCQCLQGFYFSKVIAAECIEQFVNDLSVRKWPSVFDVSVEEEVIATFLYDR
ncbi:EAL domain-containing protein [Nitrincola alkalilacustris]|uniref:EAL domain-containing protein n=1 Tax=Nitrincola alkalilacustris TaxID=1571224 RepID=UPI001456CF32|nr:EAL domain-containing protein [Nitrincola alkalilacustris]